MAQHALMLLVVLVTLVATGSIWWMMGPTPSAVCSHLDCPVYKSVYEESDFEIRLYRNATWMGTEEGSLKDVSFNRATYKGFHKLFQYIEGGNTKSEKIKMTAPVLTSVVPSAGPFCSSGFTVRFFVPPSVGSDPPPALEELKLSPTTWTHRCVAVRKFSGFAGDGNVGEEASKLALSLKGTKWENITTGERGEGEEAYSIAQYNPPFEFRDRTNEVWVTIPTNPKYDDCLPDEDRLRLKSGGGSAFA